MARRDLEHDPARGSEASKIRPGVVVSNDSANGTATRLIRPSGST
jgi:mRNA-degrading endonuclease toxin of MazEF toxin-antitoxin module